MGRARVSSRGYTADTTMGGSDHIMLDLEEWSLVLNKMLRLHYNISEEIKALVKAIRTEMKPELIPMAEEKSNFGKIVKRAIRDRQITKLEEIKKSYGEAIKDLEAVQVTRPPK